MTGIPEIRVVRDKLLVEPLYAGDKLKSGLYIPDMAQENRPALGDVFAVGAECPYSVGQRVVIRPVTGYPIDFVHGGRLVIDVRDVVGRMEGTDFCPNPEDVVIVPDWRQKYRQTSSLIYLPPSVLEQNQPVYFGIIARVGKDCTDLKVGDYVVYPYVGFELGLVDTVYYILPEKEVLATIC